MLPREILLVDDASPDGGATVFELKKLADLHRNLVSIKVVLSPENCGPGSARNRGWELACQPYIAFLDADDIWLPKKIEYQYTWMRDHPEYFLTCHQHLLKEEKLEKSISEKCDSNIFHYQEIYVNKLLLFNIIATRTVMLRSDLPYKFDEGKRYAEDYLLWLMIFFGGFRVAKLGIKLAATFKPDFGAEGLSSKLIKMELGELGCYIKLYRIRAIGFFTLIGLAIFSIIKFVRRLFLTSIQKI
jgi:glycosyltransferase involved in cell wall biosynthesis